MKNSQTVGDAIAIASQWIHASNLPFRSAFLGGSVAAANDSEPYVPTSDIDCYLVIDGEPPEGKIGKILVGGVLLDVSWLPWQQAQSAAVNAVIASLLRFGRVVRDESGELTSVRDEIVATFAESTMINIRLDDMRNRIRNGLATDSSLLPNPEQVMNWLFPATLATHLPLVAACAPLTVRKRFVAARKVMSADDYELLLSLYGFANITREQAQEWLDETASLLDATSTLAAKSSRFWSSDIRTDARAIAVGGSQQLIDAGDQREALYWIIATSTRCLTVRSDAGEDSGLFLPAFDAMTAALGIGDATDRRLRSEAILRYTGTYPARY